MSSEKKNIPQWILLLLHRFCPSHLYEEIEGDLIQKFHHDVKAFGERKAGLIWKVIQFFRPEA